MSFPHRSEVPPINIFLFEDAGRFIEVINGEHCPLKQMFGTEETTGRAIRDSIYLRSTKF